MACSSSCTAPGTHSTYGECLRGKRLHVAPVDAHMQNKSQNSQIKNYVKAREAGLQPKTVFKADVDHAWKQTERTGTPFRADQ